MILPQKEVIFVPFLAWVHKKNYRSTVKRYVSQGLSDSSCNFEFLLAEPVSTFCKLDTIANLIVEF